MGAVDPDYRTSVRRALAAIGVTTAMASAALTLGNWFMLRAIKRVVAPGDLLTIALNSAMNCLLTTAVVAPLWWWLDRRGHRRWPTAVLVGGLGGALMLTEIELAAGGWRLEGLNYLTLGEAVMGAVAGGFVGLIMWLIAYRRVPDAAEAF
ncbi:MAG: hypothetical protein JSR45_17865 [Proteobacteria bacterium]|nr:hypothetical protein [Pseudomonadota bacterium]